MRAIFGMGPSLPVSSHDGSVAETEEACFLRTKRHRHALVLALPPSVRCADGAEPLFDTYGDLEFGADGEIVATVGACHDVTQQASIEE